LKFTPFSLTRVFSEIPLYYNLAHGKYQAARAGLPERAGFTALTPKESPTFAFGDGLSFQQP